MEPLTALIPSAFQPDTICKSTIADLVRAQVDAYNAQEGELHLADGIDCPICRNKGFVAVIEETAYGPHDATARCRCQKQRSAMARLRRSGLADAVKEYRLDNFRTEAPFQQKLAELVQGFLAAEGAWLFMGGQTGCGKTHLCTAAAVELIRRGQEVHYMIWRDEAARLKSFDAPDRDERLEELKRVPVLYIDDMLKAKDGRCTDADANLAFEIINARYVRRDAVTILSSELTLTDIARVDEATAGRIAQRCGGFIANIRRDAQKNWRLRGLVEL